MTLLDSIILGIVEGVTEFLPISSTGHLILVRPLLPLAPSGDADRLSNIFDIVVQFPAVLAIVILFGRELWGTLATIRQRPDSRRFWLGSCTSLWP